MRHLREVKEVDIVRDGSPDGYRELLIGRDKLLRSDQRLHTDGARVTVWHLDTYGTTSRHWGNDTYATDTLNLHRYVVLKAADAVDLDLRV